MSGSTTRSSVARTATRPGRGRVNPVRTRSGLFLVTVVTAAALMIASVYLNVIRVGYGQDIQQLRQQVADLGSDVRDLQGQKAGMTSLPSIEQRAREMGMIYPRTTPKTLMVEVPRGEVPPTWAMPSPHTLDPVAGQQASRQLAQVQSGIGGR